MKKIVLIVGSLHLLFFLWFTLHSPSPAPLKPIRVNTIALVEPTPNTKPAPAPPITAPPPVITPPVITSPPVAADPKPEIKSEPVPEPKSKPKTKTPAPPKKTKPKKDPPLPTPTPPKPVTPPIPQKKPEDKKQKIVADAKEKIRQLAKNRANINVQPSLPSLNINAKGLAANERNYIDKLVSHLQGALILPEKGSVTVLLTLNRNGMVSKIECKALKSEMNGNYVNKELAKLKFPSFGSDFEGEQEHVFELTLSSE